jgi:AcrR family transcriptional regulator
MNKKHDTRTPKQKRSKDTKERIINAGLKVFSKKGFYKTDSKEIAREAGVSTGSFYMYFADKKDLFQEVLVDYHGKIKDVLRSIDIEKFIQSGDGRKFLRYVVNKLIEAHDIYPEFHQELNIMALSDPEINKIYEDSKRVSIDITKAMLCSWEGKIRIKDFDTAAVIVQKSTEEIVHTILFSDLNISDKQLIDELTDMLYRYLFKV